MVLPLSVRLSGLSDLSFFCTYKAVVCLAFQPDTLIKRPSFRSSFAKIHTAPTLQASALSFLGGSSIHNFTIT